MRKYSLLMIIFIFFAASGCRITESGNTNAAQLLIQNLTDISITFTLDDGSLGPDEEIILPSGSSYSRTWSLDDPLFTENNGVAILKYQNAQGYEQTVYLSISAGSTTYYDITDQTTAQLIVWNQTSSDAWFSANGSDTFFLDSGQAQQLTFGEISSSQIIELDYSGYHVFSTSENITIFPYETIDFEIDPDAGAIKLHNNSLTDLTQVYIALSSSAFWGPNRLSSPLESGESAYWTLEPDWWDVLVINEFGLETYFLENLINIDYTDYLSYRSRSDDSEQIIINKEFLEIESGKIERKIIIN